MQSTCASHLKKRTTRSSWVVLHDELGVLEKLYNHDQFPQRSTRVRLSTAFGITPTQCLIWFQNRRQRDDPGLAQMTHPTDPTASDTGTLAAPWHQDCKQDAVLPSANSIVPTTPPQPHPLVTNKLDAENEVSRTNPCDAVWQRPRGTPLAPAAAPMAHDLSLEPDQLLDLAFIEGECGEPDLLLDLAFDDGELAAWSSFLWSDIVN